MPAEPEARPARWQQQGLARPGCPHGPQAPGCGHDLTGHFFLCGWEWLFNSGSSCFSSTWTPRATWSLL